MSGLQVELFGVHDVIVNYLRVSPLPKRIFPVIPYVCLLEGYIPMNIYALGLAILRVCELFGMVGEFM